jgi:hypothetical protein
MRMKDAAAVQQIRRDATHFPAGLTIDWIRVPARHTTVGSRPSTFRSRTKEDRADNPLVLNA